MSHITIVSRSQLFAAATAISAAGLLAVPAPARAGPMIPLPLAPPCSQYAFTGDFSLRENGEQTFFSSTGAAAGGRAVSVSDDNVTKYKGTVSGGIQGRNVDFTIRWDLGQSSHYTGTVGDDALVHSGVITGQGSTSVWDSTSPLGCSTPAAPPPGPNDSQVVLAPGVKDPPPHELGPQAPPASPASPPKPLQGPTVSAKPGLTGVTFHVTDRSGVASHCTYSSEGFTSDGFTLPANGSFDLFVPAIREFRNRTGTVTCDNGTSAGTSVNF